MTIAERIRQLRKSKSISQEQLSGKTGIPVEKIAGWERGQEAPNEEEAAALGNCFNASAAYILRGEENGDQREPGEIRSFLGKTLYPMSALFIVIGLLNGLMGWEKDPSMDSVWEAMIIQAAGILVYIVARLMTRGPAQKITFWVDVTCLLFMPFSLLAGLLSKSFFHQGALSPYPTGLWHAVLFVILCLAYGAIAYRNLKKAK